MHAAADITHGGRSYANEINGIARRPVPDQTTLTAIGADSMGGGGGGGDGGDRPNSQKVVGGGAMPSSRPHGNFVTSFFETVKCTVHEIIMTPVTKIVQISA